MLSPATSPAKPSSLTPGDLPFDQRACGDPTRAVGGDLPLGHGRSDAQTRNAEGDLDRGHTAADAQRVGAPVESSNGNGHGRVVTQGSPAVADSSNGSGQSGHDSQSCTARADDLNGNHTRTDSHVGNVADTSEGNGQTCSGPQRRIAGPSEALLLILADALDDLERTRIANENRLRSLRQVKGLEGSKAEAALENLTDTLAGLEHAAALDLKRAMRQHPLGPWVKCTTGIGEKQGARLIAAIGDPAWNHAEDRLRRGPAELWAYCGYDPKQKRRKGVKSNWNADAKMRAYLCAEACMKQRTSPFRAVYDAERAKWADRDTTDLHKHNHALRVVAKEILKDLWREARRLRGAADTQNSSESPPAEDREGEMT